MDLEPSLSTIGPPVLVTLFTGLLIAFAVQLLLTSFGVAIGITALGFLPSQKQANEDDHAAVIDADQGATGRSTAGTIGFFVGLGTLLTINTVLFIACFLAVKLSLVQSVSLGAVLGVVIWAGYFLVLTWFSSRAASSLLGALTSTISAGFQGLLTTIATGLKPRPDRDSIAPALQKQMAATESALATLQQQLDAHQRQLEETLQASTDTQTEASTDPIVDLTHFLRSATPDQITLDAVKERLHPLLAQPAAPVASEYQPQSLAPSFEPKQLLAQLVRTLRSRIDLSDLDVGTIAQQIQAILPLAGGSADSVSAPTETIKTDVDDYLRDAYPWHLTRKTVMAEFKDVIYDPDADPVAVKAQLQPLDRDYFTARLKDRDDLTPAKIETIVDRLESVRQDVLESLAQAEAETQQQSFQAQVGHYLQTAKQSALKPGKLQHTLKDLLHKAEPDLNQWGDRLQSLNHDVLAKLLDGRDDLTPKTRDRLIDHLETARDRLLAEIKNLKTDLADAASEVWQAVGGYVSDRTQPLTARTIKRQLKVFLKAAKADAALLRDHLPPFDVQTATDWLAQREDLSEQQRQRILKQLQTAWDSLGPASRTVAQTAVNSSQLVSDLLNYCLQADWSNMGATDLAQSLLAYFKQHSNDDRLRATLAQLDWNALTEQLAQRTELTTAQRQQILRQLQQALDTVGKLPRRLALRIQRSTANWPDTIRDYLQSADREDLTGDHLSAAFHQLLTAGQAQAGELSQWLTSLQHSTLSQDEMMRLLAERGDLVSTEIKQIVEQAETVRQQAIAQAEAQQQQTQATLRDNLAQLRHALPDLSLAALPDLAASLDYDRIQTTVQQLVGTSLDGLEHLGNGLGDSLRDQLHDIGQDAVTTLVKTRDAMAEPLLQTLNDRVATVQSTVQQQVEAIQQGAQQRVDAIAQQAQRQAEETRKAVATAAWWLFCTALSAAFTAAIAGACAVDGIAWVQRLALR